MQARGELVRANQRIPCLLDRQDKSPSSNWCVCDAIVALMNNTILRSHLRFCTSRKALIYIIFCMAFSLFLVSPSSVHIHNPSARSSQCTTSVLPVSKVLLVSKVLPRHFFSLHSPAIRMLDVQILRRSFVYATHPCIASSCNLSSVLSDRISVVLWLCFDILVLSLILFLMNP